MRTVGPLVRSLPPRTNSLILPSPRRGAQEADDEDGSDEDEDSDEDEEEEEEEEEEGGEAAGESELSRAERRELKKKQATERAGKAAKEEKRNDGADDDGDNDEDELLANPNHVTKKLNISDLSEPRQLTRRERCVVPHALCSSRQVFPSC